MPPPLGKDPRYAELLRLFDIGIVHRAELHPAPRARRRVDPRCFELPRAAPIDRFAVQTPTEAMIADVNRADEAGETPLLVVVRRGSMQLTRMLLVAGAFVEQQDAFGRTPFWRACEAGYDDLVKFLADQVCVRHGGGLGFLVRMDEAAHAGASQPRDVAKENGHKELSEWIRKEAFRRDECMLPLYDAVDRRARPSNLCPRQPALPQKVDQAALAAEARRKQRERDEQARREILGLDSPPKTATPKLPELLPVLGEGAAAQSSSRPSSRHRVSGGRLVEMSEAEAAFRKKRKEECAARAPEASGGASQARVFERVARAAAAPPRAPPARARGRRGRELEQRVAARGDAARRRWRRGTPSTCPRRRATARAGAACKSPLETAADTAAPGQARHLHARAGPAAQLRRALSHEAVSAASTANNATRAFNSSAPPAARPPPARTRLGRLRKRHCALGPFEWNAGARRRPACAEDARRPTQTAASRPIARPLTQPRLHRTFKGSKTHIFVTLQFTNCRVMESQAKELELKADSTMLSEKELKRRLRASLRETGMVQHMTAQVRVLVPRS